MGTKKYSAAQLGRHQAGLLHRLKHALVVAELMLEVLRATGMADVVRACLRTALIGVL